MRQQSQTNEQRTETVAEIFRRLLGEIEPQPDRTGIFETPERAARALLTATSGYDADPGEVLKVFTDGAEDCDEMVMVKDIPFYSRCEHHLETIIGRATIAYIPTGKIVGLSKLARLTDIFAKRLQVQERMTTQIAHTLYAELQPAGVAVQLRARHMCMEARGVCKHGTVTTTQSLLGVFRNDPNVRREFLSLAASEAAI